MVSSSGSSPWDPNGLAAAGAGPSGLAWLSALMPPLTDRAPTRINRPSSGRIQPDGDSRGDLRLRRRPDDAAPRLLHGLPGRDWHLRRSAGSGDAADRQTGGRAPAV